MAILTKRTWVRAWTVKQPDPNYPGYLLDEPVSYQALTVTTSLFGVDIHHKEVDREIVPQWVKIDMGCFGMTDWRSKFSLYIPVR